MRRIHLPVLGLISITLVVMISSGLPSEADPLVYISATKGNDSKPCTFIQPCREFARALTVVDAGGEILVLDSGDYSPFSIGKSVTIRVVPGATAVISGHSGVFAIQLLNTTPLVVNLDGLTLHGIGSSGVGILPDGGSKLSIENMEVSGYDLGLLSATNEVHIKHSTFRNCNAGIQVHTGFTGSLDYVRLENNQTGLFADGKPEISIRDSIVSGNTDFGIKLEPIGAPCCPDVTVENSLVSLNGTGIHVEDGVVRISNSTITNNGTGIDSFNDVFSRGNNTIEANDINVDGTLQQYVAK